MRVKSEGPRRTLKSSYEVRRSMYGLGVGVGWTAMVSGLLGL